jgi:hypothetical protein
VAKAEGMGRQDLHYPFPVTNQITSGGAAGREIGSSMVSVCFHP